MTIFAFLQTASLVSLLKFAIVRDNWMYSCATGQYSFGCVGDGEQTEEKHRCQTKRQSACQMLVSAQFYAEKLTFKFRF